jgi:hypothetical protein
MRRKAISVTSLLAVKKWIFGQFFRDNGVAFANALEKMVAAFGDGIERSERIYPRHDGHPLAADAIQSPGLKR